MNNKKIDVSKKNNTQVTNVDILFIIPPFHMRNGGGSFFPLGLGYIISQVELEGFSWKAINCTDYINAFYSKDLMKLTTELAKALDMYRPSVVGIGPCITSQLRALKVISDICHKKYPSIPIFAGGPLASIEDQEWLFYENLGIDYIIKGDGELAVVDAIRNIKIGGLISDSKFVSQKGYSYVNYIEDINKIPFPYREFNDTFSIRRSKKSKKQAAMITSRGCPYSCNYCVSGNLKYNNIGYRRRSIDNILNEMQFLNQRHGVDDIVFYDDCFFYNCKTVNADVMEFCNELESRELVLTWQIEMRPDVFCELSDDSLKRLYSMGCRQINLGIEKVSNEGLEFLGKKNCWPTLEEKIKHFKKVSKTSISATFILGGGKENVNDVMNLIQKSKELMLDFAHYNPLFVYPGTPIYSLMFDNKKKWAQVIMEDDLPWGEIVYETTLLSREKLIELVEYAYKEFYDNTPYAQEAMVKDRFNLWRDNLYENI